MDLFDFIIEKSNDLYTDPDDDNYDGDCDGDGHCNADNDDAAKTIMIMNDDEGFKKNILTRHFLFKQENDYSCILGLCA